MAFTDDDGAASLSITVTCEPGHENSKGKGDDGDFVASTVPETLSTLVEGSYESNI
jgi:hypothetical protein